MKRNTTIKLLIIAIIIIATLLGFIAYSNNKAEVLNTNETPSTRLMSVEDYVKNNISELSPEKEVLGGTYYVTEIEAGEGKGVVSYEDGHNSYTADFTYTTDDNAGYTITSFIIRK